MKRAVVTLTALLLLMVPLAGHATTTSFAPPWNLGPKGGDANNYFDIHQDTGQLTIVRVQPAGVSGGLGCGGSGGFAYFDKPLEATGLTDITVSFDNAIVDPYTLLFIGVYQGDHFVRSHEERGPILGAGTLSLTIPATDGPVDIWFGIKLTSACPNIDGGTATFTGLTITSA